MLLRCRDFLVLNFILIEVGNAVDDKPWEGAAKVDDLVHQEGHDAGREHIILNIGVPRSPHALKDVEVDIVLGDLVKLAPIGIGGGGEKRRIPVEQC